MTPVVERYADAERLLAAAQPRLERDAAENSLNLGVALAWRGRPAGWLRRGTEADVETARSWIAAYVEDAGLEKAPGDDVAERAIRDAELYFRVDGSEPRSMAATARDTGASCSINGYTPPSYRNRGCATATVAALSRAVLERRRKFLPLYTDLANPTSNPIYAKIGYRPIRDDARIALEP